MKLIHCKKCHDVVRLIDTEWRTCDCKKSGGQYNEDLMTATVGGNCDIVGISNLFFKESSKKLIFNEKELRKYTKKLNHPPFFIWYGEMKGDNQIHRIKSPSGPRLKMKVEQIDSTHTKSTFLDRRNYSINVKGNKKPKFIIVENVMKSSFNDKNNRRKK